MKANEAAIRLPKGKFRLRNHYSDRVFLLKMFPGISGSVLYDLRDKGYRGFFIEAYGLGGMPFVKDDFTASVAELIRDGMTVLVGTQVLYEGANLDVYETGRKALEAGVISARDMTSEAGLTKLMWVLGQTQEPDQIRRYFETNICGEVNL